MQTQWMLLGFGFGNLVMLGWLAAAAAPLLIHLWSRRRYREVPWAAVAFLLAAMRKNSRRIQLQQWLLLAVRTLLVTFVVLAAAKPYAEQVGVGGVATHRVLVLDTSFSLSYREEEATRLARARKLAADLAERSGPGDAISVLTLAEPPRQVIDVNGPQEKVSEQIEAIAPTQGRANLSATLDLVTAALQTEANPRRRFEQQEVYFFTDLQRSTWSADLADRFAELAKAATFVVVDVGAPGTENIAVTDLRSGAQFVTAGTEVSFDATLHEFGERPREGCTVGFLVDDAPIGEQTVDVPAGGDATVRFAHRFRTPGSHVIEVRATGDRLDIDNVRWLVVRVEERVNVLCVGGQLEDIRYIVDALNPDGSEESPIRPQAVTEGELAEIDLGSFDCVFLSNVAQLTGDEAQRLARYVDEGGGLAIFLGDQVLTDSYNSLAARGRPLLPARLGEVMTESRFGVDPLEYRHDIVAPFRGRERAGLLTTPVRKYFQLEVTENSPLPSGEDRGEGTEVVLRLPSGYPLMVAATLGRGRIVLAATAGSLSSIDAASGEPWTAWPAWPSFLPVVREVLAFAVSGRQGAWQATVGSRLPIAESNPPAGILGPDGRTFSPEGVAALSGIYTVRQRGPADVAHIAVNVDTRESDLAQAMPQDLPAELSVRSNADGVTDGGNAGAILSRGDWQETLLCAALSLLIVEVCLAWLFGRGVT